MVCLQEVQIWVRVAMATPTDFLFFVAVYRFFCVFSCRNTNGILSDTYMTRDFEERHELQSGINRRLRLLCEISVLRNSRNIYC